VNERDITNLAMNGKKKCASSDLYN